MGEPTQWRGQLVLDIDIEAANDDKALEALADFASPILGPECSVAERSISSRPFFGKAEVRCDTQGMTPNATTIIERSQEVARVSALPEFFGAKEPDLHLHRTVLVETIDSALRNNYRDGIRVGQSTYTSDLAAVVKRTEAPKNVAVLLRGFAEKYDTKGWTGEANQLRDAAALVEESP